MSGASALVGGAKGRAAPWIDLVWARYLCRRPDYAALREARKRLKKQNGREKWKERKLAMKETKRLRKQEKRKLVAENKPARPPRKKLEVRTICATFETLARFEKKSRQPL